MPAQEQVVRLLFQHAPRVHPDQRRQGELVGQRQQRQDAQSHGQALEIHGQYPSPVRPLAVPGLPDQIGQQGHDHQDREAQTGTVAAAAQFRALVYVRRELRVVVGRHVDGHPGLAGRGGRHQISSSARLPFSSIQARRCEDSPLPISMSNMRVVSSGV
ncbi:hypothetical protein G6F22_019049 [Rhizopus arrhizus]|nr:hypothetical protein G6F22_019049 [Rhizopus arrhizus]